MNYTNGKIYTIKNKIDISLIYVGSTIQTLEERFRGHKRDCKIQTKYPNHKLYNIVNNDWTDWYIELYELYPCNSKEELLKYEGKIIKEIGTLNRCIAGRTVKEKNKQYRLDNASKIKEQSKQYYQDNADKIKEQKKQYYIDNKEKILEQKKRYHLDNKEKISEKNKQWYLNKKNSLSI